MQKFRQHRTQLLVATDVAARGLDVDELTHVINYGLPDDVENYTHRSGRTGRAGKRGTSISIIHLRERGKVRIIEKVIIGQERTVRNGNARADDPVDQVQILQHQGVLIISHVEHLLYATQLFLASTSLQRRISSRHRYSLHMPM